MADRGRDLKVAVLSDLDKFDVDPAAEGLEAVAEQAEKAGKALDDVDADRASRDLDKLGRNADDAGDSMRTMGKSADKLGDEAEDTAKRVDGAFDRIARASKSGVKGVDDDASKAKEGLSEMGDEAQSTAKEAAASFSDLESGLDAVQEIAANAFAGFGPAGVAAGAAAAVGIGLVFSKMQASSDEANALKDRIIELARAIDDAGGDISKVDVEGMLRDWSVEIADNKSWWEVWQKANVTNLEKVKRQLEGTGIAIEDVFTAMKGREPAKLAEVLDQINDKLAENERAAGDALDGSEAYGEGAAFAATGVLKQRDALLDLKKTVLDGAGVTEDAVRLQADLQAAFGRTAEEAENARARQEDYSDTLSGFVDPLGAYTDLLTAKEERERETAEKTAAATKDQKDSWEDYAKDVDVSVGEVIKALEKQVEAATAWSSNLATLAQRGVDDGVLAELERLGPEGAPLVAKLAKSSNGELNRWVALMAEKSRLAGQKPAEGIEQGKPAATRAAADVHAGVVAAIQGRGPVRIPTRVDPPSAAQLDYVNRMVRSGIGTIVVPVKAGTSPTKNTSNNSRYRW